MMHVQISTSATTLAPIAGAQHRSTTRSLPTRPFAPSITTLPASGVRADGELRLPLGHAFPIAERALAMEVGPRPLDDLLAPITNAALGPAPERVRPSLLVGDPALMRAELLRRLVRPESDAALNARPGLDIAAPPVVDVATVGAEPLRSTVADEREEVCPALFAWARCLPSFGHNTSISGGIDLDERNADLAQGRVGMFLDIDRGAA